MKEEILIEAFETWFNKNFPKESFGTLSGVFREGVKNDIAKKAFLYGYSIGKK